MNQAVLLPRQLGCMDYQHPKVLHPAQHLLNSPTPPHLPLLLPQTVAAQQEWGVELGRALLLLVQLLTSGHLEWGRGGSCPLVALHPLPLLGG